MISIEIRVIRLVS